MNLELLRQATVDEPVRIGRYDVHGVIGTGGMGTVFHGIERVHGTPVALKTLNDLDPDHLLRFKNEFRAVADLSNENLVELYELSREGDVWYFTMERVEGVDLVTSLRHEEREPPMGSNAPTRRGPTPQPTQPTVVGPMSVANPDPDDFRTSPSAPASSEDVRVALRQLARGVHALHSAGLLHLDIKPSNVLVDDSGRVVILDFGLTQTIATQTSRGIREVAGTPAWMAPEQYSGVNVGPAADWYAVGLILYRVLTGISAFPAGDIAVISHAKRTDLPDPPAALVPEIPRELSDLTMALLSIDPSLRPTGPEVLAILDDAIPRAAVDGPVGLIGRDTEAAIFARALALVEGGGTAVLELSGPSGVGKSALLGLLRESSDQHGALVLQGRCYERETVPYKAFDAMLDTLAVRMTNMPQQDVESILPDWLPELALAFPVLGRVPAVAERLENVDVRTASLTELRRRAVEGLRQVFVALARRAPLVLTVDDLQWIDDDSSRILTSLLSFPVPPNLLLAVGYRSQEAASNPASRAFFAASKGLVGRPGLVRIEVEPLEHDAAATLAARTLKALGVDGGGVTDAIAQESAGVPYFVEELAYFAAEHRSAQGHVPPDVVALDAVLAERVASLAPVERALVEVLAVANTPIPLEAAVEAADVRGRGVLRAIWSLKRTHFVRSITSTEGPRVELNHDRLRESVVARLGDERLQRVQLALATALSSWTSSEEAGPLFFAMVRHLNGAAPLLAPDQRVEAAQQNLLAARTARRLAAFPLAFEHFESGIALLEDEHWNSEHQLMLNLHNGAADAAYLTARWDAVAAHFETVMRNSSSVLEQLPAWQALIDSKIARKDYDAAVDRGLEVLEQLGVELPAHPDDGDVKVAVERAIGVLVGTGPDGFEAFRETTNEREIAADRLQTRLGSAAYFGRPRLLPILAANLVTRAADRGVSLATPYALSLLGIVLNSIGMYELAHTWGNVADELLQRLHDPELETRTRHCIHNLVCNLIEPLHETLSHARSVYDRGMALGDIEYAGYSIHAYVHNSIYAGLPLEPLYDEAAEITKVLLEYEEVNALYVHTPFEQMIRCFLGLNANPASLDGESFSEAEAFVAASRAGSDAAGFVIRVVTGIVRYHFSQPRAALRLFEEARALKGGAPSTWHLPMFHQYAALAAYATEDADSGELARADADYAELEALEACCPHNYAHRTALLRAERGRRRGENEQAKREYEAAMRLARENHWPNDLGLACELAARFAATSGDDERAAQLWRDAEAAYREWGATAKVDHVRLRPVPPASPQG